MMSTINYAYEDDAVRKQQSPLPTSLGRLVRFWRTTFELSQEELALSLDSSPRHISRIENGFVQPSRQVILRIANRIGLRKRDTSNLLIAGGYIPHTNQAEFRKSEYRWLRRTMAMNLGALDPYPAMINDGGNGILMVNKSWLGLFHDKLDLSRDLKVSDYFAAIMEAVALGVDDEDRLNTMCSVSLSLKQEALIRNEPVLEALLSDIEKKYELPKNWPALGAKFDPRMSFPVFFEFEGQVKPFFHLATAVASLGPVDNAMEPHLLKVELYPRDQMLDTSALVDHDIDHPALHSHELAVE